MKSPFRDIHKAFSIFFDERIVCIIKKDTKEKKVSVDCCVMDDITSDGILDDTMDTDQRNFSIVTNQSCECLSLQRGDKILTCTNKKYAVMSVVDDKIFGKVIKARLI